MCALSIAMLCAGRFGLGWAYDAIIFACHMFMHFHAYAPLIFYISIYLVVGTFLIVFLSFFLSFSPSYISCVMAPKHKSTPSRNSLRSRVSSFFSPSNPTPSHIWFRDEKAKSDFFKNFSQRGIHSKLQVVLSDFSDINLPLSSTVGVRSHYMVSWLRALPWSYMSSTLILMVLIILYLSLSLTFGVYAW